MGPGGGLVQLFNGATIAVIGSGYPFGGGFTGGVTLAVGDLNGDGRARYRHGPGKRRRRGPRVQRHRLFPAAVPDAVWAGLHGRRERGGRRRGWRRARGSDRRPGRWRHRGRDLRGDPGHHGERRSLRLPAGWRLCRGGRRQRRRTRGCDCRPRLRQRTRHRLQHRHPDPHHQLCPVWDDIAGRSPRGRDRPDRGWPRRDHHGPRSRTRTRTQDLQRGHLCPAVLPAGLPADVYRRCVRLGSSGSPRWDTQPRRTWGAPKSRLHGPRR